VCVILFIRLFLCGVMKITFIGLIKTLYLLIATLIVIALRKEKKKH